jgi:hypothetical protein
MEKNLAALESENKVLLHHIETRIDIVNGKVKAGVDKQGNNLLEIEIPLPVDHSTKESQTAKL